MDITPYAESLARDLAAAAETGTDDVRRAADRLTTALMPAVRLALMEAISHAAAEITAEMPAGSVDVRLDGRDLEFVVHGATPLPPAPPPATEETDEGDLARITLRIPESVKTRAEEKASAAGQSLNTWLVGVVRRATSDHAINVDIDLSSIPFIGSDPFGGKGGRGRRMSGWI